MKPAEPQCKCKLPTVQAALTAKPGEGRPRGCPTPVAVCLHGNRRRSSADCRMQIRHLSCLLSVIHSLLIYR